MKVGKLIEELKDMPPEADVYYSTGSSLDNNWGSQHEVEYCFTEQKTFGILLPPERQRKEWIVVLEGS